MTNLENLILNLKKSLGWVLKREDTNKYLESLDFYKLHNSMNELKENN